MFKSCRAAAILLIAMPGTAGAGYLDDNPEEVFAGVYERALKTGLTSKPAA
jgi:hypothetical protein